MKILLPETKAQGLAGSRTQTMPAPGPPISKFPVRGSRKETEINGLAGSGEQTGRPAAFSESPGPWFVCVQLCEVTFTTNPKNNFEKNKKSTGQEGGSSV